MNDTRDLRDPQKLGELLMTYRGFSHCYDEEIYHMERVPNYPQDESMATITAREYRAELEARDDVYAKQTLRDLEAGKGVQGFDDAG